MRKGAEGVMGLEIMDGVDESESDEEGNGVESDSEEELGRDLARCCQRKARKF